MGQRIAVPLGWQLRDVLALAVRSAGCKPTRRACRLAQIFVFWVCPARRICTIRTYQEWLTAPLSA